MSIRRCDLLAKLSQPTRQHESSIVHKGVHGCHEHRQQAGQVATGGWGTVPGTPSPSIFVYNICVCEKVRKGKGGGLGTTFEPFQIIG